MRALMRAAVVVVLCIPSVAVAAPWALDANVQLPELGFVAQKLELVDINNDGFVDIAFANCSGDAAGGPQSAQHNQLIINNSGVGFTESWAFDEADNAYVIKAGDVDNDGDADLVVGVNFSGQSYVLLNEGDSLFSHWDIAASANKSIGDLELGDVDGDGDLDIVATDWGSSEPYGDAADQGAPIRLWLGNGDGTFDNGDTNLPLGMDTWAAWSFDIELVDVDNDYALDVLVSSRGVGFGFGLYNDGTGNFLKLTVPALESNIAKQFNAAFTPTDITGDGWVDLITLQDGVGQGGNCVDIMGLQYCAKRNSVLVNDGMGNYPSDNQGGYWAIVDNPVKLDFDAATLDFNNDGRPDLVTTGPRLGANDKNSRLFLNKNGTSFQPAPAPLDAAFPIVPELAQTFGLQFADFDHDRREDVALASRDALLPNFVLFGREDPTDGVPVDTRGPRIYDDGFASKVGTLLFFGQDVGIQARVDDYKTPVRWHDFMVDGNLAALNRIGDGATLTAHNRRLPYMEFALGLADPQELVSMADDDPKKFIAPSIWFGEALWRVNFTVPYAGSKTDTLTWQFCAIDAAENRACVGPFSAQVEVDPEDCGDGEVQEWESCDSGSPTCILCEETCGNGLCDAAEDLQNCIADCEPEPVPTTGTGESAESGSSAGGTEESSVGEPDCDGVCEASDPCAADCDPTGDAPSCGDGECAAGEREACPMDCAHDSATTGTGIDLPGGCACEAVRSLDAFGLLGGLLFLLRRRRSR